MKQMKRIKVVALMTMALALMIGSGFAHAATSFSGTVNINTASQEQLMELPGIGPSKAKAIVDYRTANPFKSVDEITQVKGVGDKLFAKLSPHLTVSGDTRLGMAYTKSPGSGAKKK